MATRPVDNLSAHQFAAAPDAVEPVDFPSLKRSRTLKDEEAERNEIKSGRGLIEGGGRGLIEGGGRGWAGSDSRWVGDN